MLLEDQPEKIRYRTLAPHTPATPAAIRAEVERYLWQNPPKAGRDATPEDIAFIVGEYFAAHPVQHGKDGESVTPEQVAEAVADYLRAHPPKDGEDGTDGTGLDVARTRIESNGHLILAYTDGTESDMGRIVGYDGRDITEKELKKAVADYFQKNPIPKQQTVYRRGGGGITEARVLELIAENGGSEVAGTEQKTYHQRFTTAGTHPLTVPLTSGKKLRFKYFNFVGSPDNSATENVTLQWARSPTEVIHSQDVSQYGQPHATSLGQNFVTGETDELPEIVLTVGQTVDVNIRYEEVD